MALDKGEVGRLRSGPTLGLDRARRAGRGAAVSAPGGQVAPRAAFSEFLVEARRASPTSRAGQTDFEPLRRLDDDGQVPGADSARASQRARRDDGGRPANPRQAADAGEGEGSTPEAPPATDGEAVPVSGAVAPAAAVQPESMPGAATPGAATEEIAAAEADAGQAEAPPSPAPRATLWQVPQDAEPTATPTATAPRSGGQAGAGPRLEPATEGQPTATAPEASALPRASALDLLTPTEVADAEVLVDGDNQLMERLQQALGSGNTQALDELGEPLVPQVVRSMAALARNGVSEMRLQLQPPDLGQIELRVRAIEGLVRGDVVVQHAEVKHLLESQLERLRVALADWGLELEGFDVGLSEDGAFAGDWGGGDDRGRSPVTRDRTGGAAVPETPAGAAPRRPVRLDPDAVDWLV